MDYRRRVKYKLARISEEDEEENEANEGTPMMEEHNDDDGVFGGEGNQESVPDPTADGTADGPADDNPTPPVSDDEADDTTGVEVHVLEPESLATASVNDEVEVHVDEDAGADGGNHEGEDRDTPVASPPTYQDPPSYTEAVGVYGAKSPSGLERQDDDLEWDRDESVQPNIVVNPFNGSTSEPNQGDIEMGEMTGQTEPSSDSAAAIETSYITPGLGSINRFVEPMEIESQSVNELSCSDGFDVSFKDMSSRSLLIMLFSVLVVIVAVLIVVLLPLTFSYVEYYELGLKRQRSTGQVVTGDGTFDLGRYAIGPDYTFKKYPSWATNVQMDSVEVTTTSGLTVSFSCSFQYFLREKELGVLEQRFDQGYADIIISVATAALKNVAATTSLDRYLQERRQVEISFHEALRVKLEGDCCPDRERCIRYGTCHLCSNSTTLCSQGYHVDVPYFQLQGIDLPDVIIGRNLQVQLLLEQTEMEAYVQQTMLTRKETERLTEIILNSASEIANNGTAQASLIQALGEAEARALLEAANSKGLALMYDRMGVSTDKHKASLHWLRTLEKQELLVMGISFEEYLELVRDYIVT